MKRRTRKAVVFYCDRPGCNRQHVAPFTDFKLAWAHAKSAGWVAMPNGNGWLQFCDWVHRPANDRQLKEILKGNEQPASVVYGK